MSGKLVTWFAIVLIVLLADAVLSYRAVRTLIRNEHLVSHTHHTLIELEGTLSTMREAETGQRGYLLTGRDEYLESYDSALANIDRRMKQVKNLTAGNSNEQRLVSVLEPMVKAKLDKMSDNIAVRECPVDLHGRGRVVRSVGVGDRTQRLIDERLRGIRAERDYERAAGVGGDRAHGHARQDNGTALGQGPEIASRAEDILGTRAAIADKSQRRPRVIALD